jgi:hypothetical protein
LKVQNSRQAVTHAKWTNRRIADFAKAAICHVVHNREGMKRVTAHKTNFASIEDCDARSTALALMTQALELMDGDKNVGGIASAHLQMAIDSLWRRSSAGLSSLDLH